VRLHSIVRDLETARSAVVAGASVLRLAAGLETSLLIAAGLGLRRLGTTFFVVDDVEAALELGADGVHLDLHSEREELARGAGLRVGASASSYLGSLAAQAEYLDVEIGAEEPTEQSSRESLAELARICGSVAVPVIARGAIDSSNVALYIAAGAAGVAVDGAPQGRALREAVDEALAERAAASLGRNGGRG
jgi:thiamine-phosphate pyrophosphorylase